MSGFRLIIAGTGTIPEEVAEAKLIQCAIESKCSVQTLDDNIYHASYKQSADAADGGNYTDFTYESSSGDDTLGWVGLI